MLVKTGIILARRDHRFPLSDQDCHCHQGDQLRRLEGPERYEPASALCRLALVRDSRLLRSSYET